MNFQSQSAKSNNLRLQQPLSVCSNLRRSLVEESVFPFIYARNDDWFIFLRVVKFFDFLAQYKNFD